MLLEEEEKRDYDMRGLARLEKNSTKKLKGARKRKEDKITKGLAGTAFEVNIKDERFAALIDGSDPRFGIDRTDPNFKETPAMKVILSEQTKRRRTRKEQQVKRLQTNNKELVKSIDSVPYKGPELSSLVNSIKRKVKN